MDDRALIGQRLTGRHLLSRRMAGRLEGEKVLDIGCGAGWFLEHAIESGCARAVGIERSPALVRLLAEKLPAAEVFELDATRELLSLEKFDTVCAFDFLEHLPAGSEPEFLRHAAQVLERGGRLLLSVPYRGLLSCALDPAFYFGHRHYRFEDVARMLKRAGFTIEETVYAGGIWEQVSVIWLYLFKWVFRREMAFAGLLESKREAEYSRPRARPGRVGAFATMFIRAALPAEQPTAG